MYFNSYLTTGQAANLPGLRSSESFSSITTEGLNEVAATKTIPSEVLLVLQNQTECKDNTLKIRGQLDRKLYAATDKVLQTLGGKWNRSAGCHIFQEEVWPMIADAIATGQYVDAKQQFQFFETQDREIDMMIAACGKKLKGAKLLEPSAGTGRIAKKMRDAGAGEIKCFEIQQKFVDQLKKDGFDATCADFLTVEPTGDFDIVTMNPPFTRSQDIKHIMHAWEFLKPNGLLISIASPGYSYRGDRLAGDFREFLYANKADVTKIDSGAFKKSGTNIETVMIVAKKLKNKKRK